MCERAAARLDDPPAVVLPALAFGVTRYGAAFAGAIGITEATLRAVVLDVAASVEQQGFRRLVIVNNHFEPEQVVTLRAAAADAGALYLDLVRRRNAQRLTDEFRRGSCHAGRYETSLVLADAPQLVDSSAADLPAERGRHARGDGRRSHRLPRDGHGPRLLRRARGGQRRGGPRDLRDPDRHARRARPAEA